MSLKTSLMNEIRDLINKKRYKEAYHNLEQYENMFGVSETSCLNISLCMLKDESIDMSMEIGLSACNAVIDINPMNPKPYLRRSAFQERAQNWLYAYADLRTYQHLSKDNTVSVKVQSYYEMHLLTLNLALKGETHFLDYYDFIITLKGMNYTMNVKTLNDLHIYNTENNIRMTKNDFFTENKEDIENIEKKMVDINLYKLLNDHKNDNHDDTMNKSLNKEEYLEKLKKRKRRRDNIKKYILKFK